ncbi:hypothetical protein O9G_000937 [Rozella allomycis CSF55]|uniref:Uncharacterized protein n=1 Tax=Rozella allomycis (strain CSF55) TaxID=988480 RepID=A0A075ANA9_ROZAC|nr:hypothetical protein O9G_000937 [Rozella allomycis CSF55]|eukprot:EPZ31292.1 hypothetical protein O9G_000937 [Rozella allomycis CSF55]
MSNQENNESNDSSPFNGNRIIALRLSGDGQSYYTVESGGGDNDEAGTQTAMDIDSTRNGLLQILFGLNQQLSLARGNDDMGEMQRPLLHSSEPDPGTNEIPQVKIPRSCLIVKDDFSYNDGQLKNYLSKKLQTRVVF